MKRLPLRSSPEYDSRLGMYVAALKEGYGREVAIVFLDAVVKAEKRIKDNCNIGKSEPYLLNGNLVTLEELYFESGPETYGIIFSISDSFVGLVSIWHGRGSRQSKLLRRLWR